MTINEKIAQAKAAIAKTNEDVLNIKLVGGIL